MAGSSVTGTGHGAVEGPVRWLIGLTKVLKSNGVTPAFEIQNNKFVEAQSGGESEDIITLSTTTPLEGGGTLDDDRTLSLNYDSVSLGLDGTNNSLYVKDDGHSHASSGDGVFDDVAISEGNEKWDDLRIPGSNTRPGTTAPAVSLFRDGIYLDEFVYNQVDTVFFSIQLPHHWKEGSDIYPHIHWAHNTAGPAIDKGVVWKLEYSWANAGEILPPSSTLTAALTWTSAPPAQYKHIITQFLDGSNNEYIDGTGKKISSMLICRLYRDTSDDLDNFTGSAFLLEIDFHYQVDSLGSDQEYIK